jgi:hypothetical protein
MGVEVEQRLRPREVVDAAVEPSFQGPNTLSERRDIDFEIEQTGVLHLDSFPTS